MPVTEAAPFFLNVRITDELRRRLDRYCETMTVGKRAVVQRALEDFLDEREGQEL